MSGLIQDDGMPSFSHSPRSLAYASVLNAYPKDLDWRKIDVLGTRQFMSISTGGLVTIVELIKDVSHKVHVPVDGSAREVRDRAGLAFDDRVVVVWIGKDGVKCCMPIDEFFEPMARRGGYPRFVAAGPIVMKGDHP